MLAVCRPTGSRKPVADVGASQGSSPLVADRLEQLLAYAMRDFVASWYFSSISNEDIFVREVRTDATEWRTRWCGSPKAPGDARSFA